MNVLDESIIIDLVAGGSFLGPFLQVLASRCPSLQLLGLEKGVCQRAVQGGAAAAPGEGARLVPAAGGMEVQATTC